VLAWADETQIDRDIALTEIDIENLIRAKGAIFSGCMTLLTEVGMGMQDIDRIILAGGFGSYVDLEKAMTIGLLPEIDADKVTFIGNSSLLGAKMSSLTNRIRKDVVEVTRSMTNFELSETPSYMDNYVAALFLPHTDMNQFPATKRTNGTAAPRNNCAGVTISGTFRLFPVSSKLIFREYCFEHNANIRQIGYLWMETIGSAALFLK
jgi:uncharacterized 2Fe-2S/4Fe-4S cluster protein (DUF4445 family)